jgi:hypothetical protein
MMLIVAIASAIFTAQQSTAAEVASDQAREASNKANATNEEMARFQQRHVAVQLVLEEFKSSFLNDCQDVIRELNSLTATIGEKIAYKAWDQQAITANWQAIRTKIRMLKQAARQCEAINQTDQLQCFVSEPYDGLANSFDKLISSTDVTQAEENFEDVERSAAVFVAALQSLCVNARSNILASLYEN